MVTVDDVRAVLARLPRSSEVLVRDRVKFRVGQIVYVAFEVPSDWPDSQTSAGIAIWLVNGPSSNLASSKPSRGSAQLPISEPNSLCRVCGV